MSKKTGSSLLAFLLGAATGAALGILYAPDKGSNTRDRLSFKLDKYKKMLEELLEDLVSGKEIQFSEAKEESKRVVSQAKEKAERLLEDVDSLISQIKGSDKK
ncbi:MAG: YtxH domain-containing protein [Cyclobacteriaceae bacterium]|nr:YtxH domain-containing protein [Cyclobacteriaceae bacterium]